MPDQHRTLRGNNADLVLKMFLYKKLSAHNEVFSNADTPGKTREEISREAQTADVYLSSLNGISENGELINRKFDKGRALIRVCEREGIPLKDSVAFGDSANDREMLETAGLSVCMENGSDDMKRIADMICPAVWDDGLYRAFEEIGLL